MHSKVQQEINQLKNDSLHGANWLSIQAIHILGQAMQETEAATVSEFISELRTIAAAIAEARPSMTSIANYIAQLVSQIVVSSQGEKQIDRVKNMAQSKVNQFVKLVQEAAVKAAQNGARLIVDHDIIITCSYSSTVCTTFTIAREKAVEFEVIVAESRYNNTLYGEISAEQLKLHQIPVTLVADTDIERCVRQTSKALVGADTVGRDGSVINGIPTYRLARAAASASIPFYSICETAKFNVLAQHRKQSPLEPGFNLVPPDLITGIVTEAGMLKPGDVKNLGASNLAGND